MEREREREIRRYKCREKSRIKHVKKSEIKLQCPEKKDGKFKHVFFLFLFYIALFSRPNSITSKLILP